MQIEQEIKLQLCGKDYARLLIYLDLNAKALPLRKQDNHYFDTLDRSLLKEKSMLRIRLEGDLPILTFKAKIAQTGGTFKSQESEFELQSQARDPLILLQRARESLDLACLGLNLQYLGTLRNLRRPYLWQELVLEVDQSIISPIRTDYELEVECENIELTRQKLQALLSFLEIPWQEQNQTKAHRFFENRG